MSFGIKLANQPESSQPAEAAQTDELKRHGVALEELQKEIASLRAAFCELARLKSVETELAAGFQQICDEERQILSNTDSAEKEAVKKLLETRSRKDIRQVRLAEARKRVAAHIDVLICDIGRPLRAKFLNFGQTLLAARLARVQKDLRSSPAGWSWSADYYHNVDTNSEKTLEVRRVINWVAVDAETDQAKELKALEALPDRWLEAFRNILISESDFPVFASQ